MRGEILTRQDDRIFQKHYLRIGARKLPRTGLAPARAWCVQAVGMVLTERLKLRRQMASAACKKESVSLLLFMLVNNLEVEENVSDGHAGFGGRKLDGKMDKKAKLGFGGADFRGSGVEASERTCRSRCLKDRKRCT